MNKGKLVALLFVWIAIVGILAMGYKWVVVPHHKHAAQETAQKQQEEIVAGTSASSRYDTEINFAIDSFCGFSVFRTPEFADEMAKSRIKVNLIDDGADYDKRIKAFDDNTDQMGVFTADALIKASADSGKAPPAVIVGFVDETRGADAMVAYKDAFPNIDSLNSLDTKIVSPLGPSDTLTRVIISHFHLGNLSPSPFIHVNDAEAVFQNYRKAKPDAKQVYVLWEPWISKILDNPNTHILVDSSEFHGYIMDVIVANRNFLYSNPDTVKDVLCAYFKVLYKYHDQMPSLLVDDGKRTDSPLSEKDAQRIVKGIWWKNTIDNYAQMGLSDRENVENIEDALSNITKVLISTKAIQSDPANGKMNLFYYDGILKKMKESNFFPGAEQGHVDDDQLAALSDTQWNELQPVGLMNLAPISFSRGTSTLSDVSTQSLDDLITKIKSWPNFYIKISSNVNPIGDLGANQTLAIARGNSVSEYLANHGVSADRMKVFIGDKHESSVEIIMEQMPY